MNATYYDRHGVTVHAGDCLDVLATFPDASVHAVICDPPYGLADIRPAQVIAALTAWANGDREHVPNGRGFMGRDWDAFVPPPAVWDECLRVLTPGGHLVAFAGSRTYDLMGLSIRMAGFEIRDGLQWLYSQGFPKSLDVSKAIDKLNGRGMELRYQLARHIRDRREASVVTRSEVAARFPQYREVTANWERTDGNGNRVPTPADWAVLAPWLGLSDEWLPLIERVEAEREVIGKGKSGAALVGFARDEAGSYDVTAPATETSQRWSGWGTALKPAHEPIVCAQKPFNAVPSWDVVNTLHHALGGLLWLSASPAKRAELSSTSSPHALPEDACASALADAVLGTSRGKSATTATFNSQALASTSSNIATSWSAILAALSGQTRTFTTATASSTTTALQTLNSLLAPITSPTTMPRCACLTGGSTSPAQSADDSSSDAWARWRHTQSASAPESAIEGIALAVSSALASVAEQLSNEQAAASTAQQSARTGPPMSGDSSLSGLANAAGSSSSLAETLAASVRSTAQGSPSTAGSRPAHEPIVLARKPLSGTVAATVIAHGTGALHVDACRTGGAEGRWPANVLLDEGAAAELDAQSGILHSQDPATRASKSKRVGTTGFGTGESVEYADKGGASRFFPVFRWEAKAPTLERPQVDGVAHPTVKPLAVMRWLVRLLTPPGGLVLDPFAGSGTTLHAARAEGFRAIGIEREPSYLPLIKARLDARPRAASGTQTATDNEPMDLLDLLTEDGAA